MREARTQRERADTAEVERDTLRAELARLTALDRATDDELVDLYRKIYETHGGGTISVSHDDCRRAAVLAVAAHVRKERPGVDEVAVSEVMRVGLAQCDALLSPVAPTPAYPLGEKTGDPMEMYLGDIYTVPANITGLPALSIPCGLSRGGLPIGMSLMGARGSLARMLGAAAVYERAERVAAGAHPYDRVEGSDL